MKALGHFFPENQGFLQNEQTALNDRVKQPGIYI